MRDSATQSRLEALEIHAAEQERMLQELSDTIADQWRTIDALRRELDGFKRRLAEAEAQLDGAQPPDPPPPHY